MTKLRKQRRKKVYRHNVNRKRLRNKQTSTGKVACKPVAAEWETQKSIRKNLAEMGLAYDPNVSLKIPKSKEELDSMMKRSAKTKCNMWTEETISISPSPAKKHVAEALEKDAKAPRVKLFRLPKGQVEWITYLMDKYGTDYRAMTRDRKNYNQETWKQLRAKIKRFMSIPEQYAEYLDKKGLLYAEGEDELNPDALKVVCDSDSD